MEIKKIKIYKVLTCKEDESVKEIAKKLRKSKERRIFVVDKQENLVGIVTTTDLVYKALGEGSTGLIASDVMTRNVKAVDSKGDLNKALEIMNELKSFTCPVTEDTKLIGVISYHDLVGYVLASMQED